MIKASLPPEPVEGARIGLAQGHIVLVRKLHQPFPRPVRQLGVAREGGVLLLHGRVDNNLREVGGFCRARAGLSGISCVIGRLNIMPPWL